MPNPTRSHPLARIFRRLVSGATRRTVETTPKRRVWRISASAPGGEWVDPDSAPAPVSKTGFTQPQEPNPSGWLTSSMDLLGGAEVVEWPDAPAARPRQD